MTEDAAAPDQFLAQWTPQTAPACPVGLELLRNLAEGFPSLYALAQQRDFLDPPHPAFRTNPAWQAFAQHCSTCPDCNEA